jgi:hypothetical protein
MEKFTTHIEDWEVVYQEPHEAVAVRAFGKSIVLFMLVGSLFVAVNGFPVQSATSLDQTALFDSKIERKFVDRKSHLKSSD